MKILLLAFIATTLLFAARSLTLAYTVTASLYYDTPIISFNSPTQNSIFDFSYNPAAFQPKAPNSQETCLLVRCQNISSTTNPLGSVTPSKISITCAPHPAAIAQDYSPITASSVIFQPESQEDVLGTEDPRVLQVGDTLFMFYTAVSPAPENQGATARLSLATCQLNGQMNSAKDPSCWKRQGALFPDYRPGFQFTKSGALLHDTTGKLGNTSYLIYGDSSIIEGLQVATTTDLIHYNVINEFVLIKPRPGMFDNGLVEAGPPPLQLPDGNWFFIYNSAQTLYGVPNQLFYNPGYLILNGSDPLQVLQRSEKPLLMPRHTFEAMGLTPYVVFVEGMVPFPNSSSSSSSQQRQKVINDKLEILESVRVDGATTVSFLLYCGAGDTNVAVAKVTISY